MASHVIVKYNHIPEIKREMPAAIESQVQAAAYACEAYAKDLCPVDTGALKASIKADKESALLWTVAPHTEYAVYVEFGTRRMRAQPYMRPAAERVRVEFPKLLVSAIVKVAGGGGGWFAQNAPDVTVEEGG